MPRKDPRFNPKYAKALQKREDDNKIEGAEIGNNTILEQHLASSSVTTSKIADGSVTTSKIADGNVTSSKLNLDYLIVDGQQLFNTTSDNTVAAINPLWSIFDIRGYKYYTDDHFASGNNSINVYNNATGSAVTHTRKNSGFIDSTAATPPNSSGYVIEIKHAPTTSLGTSPHYGGWYFATATAASRELICVFTMKVPVGRYITWHSNDIGDNGTHGWLTSNQGTGKYQTYAYYVNSGTSGSFSSTMFFAIYGGNTNTFYTYLASATVYNVTQCDSDNFRNLNASGTSTFRSVSIRPSKLDLFASDGGNTEIRGGGVWIYPSSHFIVEYPNGSLVGGLYWDFKSKYAGFPQQTSMRLAAPQSGPGASYAYRSDWPSGWGGGLSTWDIVCASIKTANGIVTSSDIRIKNNINPVSFGLDFIKKLEPVTYYWNKEHNPYEYTRKQYGFIAQDIEKLEPCLVLDGSYDEQTGQDGFKSLNYTGFIPILTKAIQEQQKTIESLEARLKALEDLLK